MNPLIFTYAADGAKALGGLGILGGGIRWGGQVIALFTNMSRDIGDMKTDLHEIKTNHLPHMDAKIDNLKDAFHAHLIEAAKKVSE